MSNKILNIVFASVLALGFTNIALADTCCNQEDDNRVVRHKHHSTKHHNTHMHYAHKDVVVSSSGNFVRDSNGGCVRTKFDVGTDKCCEHKHQSPIMHMDERIVYFDFDKADLKDSEKAKLDVLADAIRENNIYAVKVVGYTDRIGHHDYNHRLSHQRANSVRSYLGSKVKLQSNLVTLRGLGEANQVKTCSDIKDRGELINCLAPNRRVEVEVDYTVQRRK